MSQKQNLNSESIDPAMLQSIVRRVMQQLVASPAGGSPNDSGEDDPAESVEQITDRVVTAQIIESKIGRTRRLQLIPNAIVTPAARDVARTHRMEFIKAGDRSLSNATTHSDRPSSIDVSKQPFTLRDCNDDKRERLVRTQLARRGVAAIGKFVLADRPAAELYHQIADNKEVAVMVTSLEDVDRFELECSPSTWVLDMKRLNLPAAINVIVRVTQVARNKH